MKQTFSLIALAMVAGFSSAPHAEGDTLDAKHIQAMQSNVEKQLAGKTGAEAYGLAKARAWLDLALDEFHEDDRTGIIQSATEEADKLLKNPASSLPFTTPVSPQLPGSEVIRQDLWNRIATMHASPDFDCAARQLGQLEVMLNWAGHEKWESGWSHAKPYVDQVENLTYDAETTIKQCASIRLAATPTASDTPLPPPPTVTVEHFTFATDALFKFNKDGIEHLVDGEQRKLAAMANLLKRWKTIDKIEIVGHTDRLGTEKYNESLSIRRAQHVRAFLLDRGFSAEQTFASGKGELEPLIHCNGTGRTASLIACLQPNRRVEILVTGIR